MQRTPRDEETPVAIVPIAKEHIAGFRKCLDAVSKERRYLAFLEARSLAVIRKFVLGNIRAGNPGFVAVKDGCVVGWCDICRMDRLVYQHAGVLGMGITREFRGQGLGRRLILAALKRAREADIERVELTVYASNRRAIRLYKSVGFVREGIRRKGRKLDGVYEDVWMMARLCA